MAAIFWLVLLAMIALRIHNMWRKGQITGFAPQTSRERGRLIWVGVGAVNFVAFVAHLLKDGTSAFPSGGRFIAGHYLVLSHGRDISFTPSSYWFSYVHGVIFVIVHIVCMVAVWRLRQNKDSMHETEAA